MNDKKNIVFKIVLIFAVIGSAEGCYDIGRHRDYGFSEVEAREKIGKRVRCVECSSIKTIGKRRSDPQGGWLELKAGDKGVVREIEEISQGEYYLIVYWDEPKEEYPYRSYFRKSGKFSIYKECLAEE